MYYNVQYNGGFTVCVPGLLHTTQAPLAKKHPLFLTHEAKIKELLCLTPSMMKITTQCCHFQIHEAKIKEWLRQFSEKSGYQLVGYEFVENSSGYQLVGYQKSDHHL